MPPPRDATGDRPSSPPCAACCFQSYRCCWGHTTNDTDIFLLAAHALFCFGRLQEAQTHNKHDRADTLPSACASHHMRGVVCLRLCWQLHTVCMHGLLRCTITPDVNLIQLHACLQVPVPCLRGLDCHASSRSSPSCPTLAAARQSPRPEATAAASPAQVRSATRDCRGGRPRLSGKTIRKRTWCKKNHNWASRSRKSRGAAFVRAKRSVGLLSAINADVCIRMTCAQIHWNQVTWVKGGASLTVCRHPLTWFQCIYWAQFILMQRSALIQTATS